MSFLRDTIGDVVTVHHGHTPEIDLTSPTTATGVWAMEDMLRWPVASSCTASAYHETYDRADGTWRIKHSLARRADFREPSQE